MKQFAIFSKNKKNTKIAITAAQTLGFIHQKKNPDFVIVLTKNILPPDHSLFSIPRLEILQKGRLKERIVKALTKIKARKYKKINYSYIDAIIRTNANKYMPPPANEIILRSRVKRPAQFITHKSGSKTEKKITTQEIRIVTAQVARNKKSVQAIMVSFKNSKTRRTESIRADLTKTAIYAGDDCKINIFVDGKKLPMRISNFLYSITISKHRVKNTVLKVT